MAGTSVGTIVLDLKADTAQFHKALGTAESGAKRFSSSISSSLDRAVSSSKTFAKVLGGVGAGMIFAGKKAADLASEYQQNSIALETMLGSTEKARGLLKDITTFAKKTPFELPGVVNASKTLLAMGIEAEKVIPTLKGIGNAAAGTGADLQRIIFNYGQVRTQTRLTGVELKDFLRNGIPILTELAKNLNVTESEVKEMVEAGKVGFSDVEHAFETMSGEGGKFFNLMEKQSRSFSGIMSNIKDSIGIAVTNIIGLSTDTGEIREGSIFAVLNQQASAIQNWLEGNGENMIAWFETFMGFLKDNGATVAGVIGGALVPAVWALAAAVWGTLAPLIPFMAVGALIGTLANQIAERFGGWVVVMDSIKLKIQEFWEEYGPGVISTLQTLKEKAEKTWEQLKNIWSIISDFLKPVLLELWYTIKEQVIPELERFWAEHGEEVKKVLKAILIVVGALTVLLAGAFLVALTAVLKLVAFLSKQFNDASEKLSDFKDWLDKVGNKFDWISGKAQTFLDILSAITTGGATGIGTIFEKAGEALNLSGQKAEGGPVMGSGKYLVGERGPELFVPNTSGTIIPNKELGNMQTSTNNITYNVSLNSEAAVRAFEEKMKKEQVANNLGGYLA